MALTVTVLRELFRNYQQFRALYETEGIDELQAPDGEVYSIFDIHYLYEQRRKLPPRQRQAIELCLVQNIRESEAAVMMGVSPTNPVAMYATSGLEKLITMVRSGDLACYREGDHRERANGHS